MRWSGEHLKITYGLEPGRLVLRAIDVDPSALLSQGTARIRQDWAAFLERVASGRAIELHDPDPSQRLLLELIGFRGDVGLGGVMRFRPDLPRPRPVFGAVRPGAFSEDTLIRLEDGREAPARDLDVGDRLDQGGMITEIIEGLISETARCASGCVSALSAVWDGQAWVRVTNHPDFTPEPRPEGARFLFLTTERHVVRMGEHLLTDSWETEAARAERFDMQPEVLRVLNGANADE